ncbi:inosine triphosphate pyrophosphatase-like protein [Thamnocephalis sphaerospora]|uniref:Inosine triphosphate pyrophosphatase-like protein n=1 Tax=Thamnocephalis sphaerospora TaxID=78915 RepID=A0A4P9XZF9_9FUNG|nr:inosine triphosphate pyrophosphatase-like protein [Thamnocephalis sphaerospora]|eukprot:RKP10860.1 inosine triphosphate pyrophosphatase-like protein [Thamnocephalis sphaerospora]
MTSAPLLLPGLAALQGKRVVLASSSPRRREILALMGVPYEVISSDFEENLDKSRFAHPRDYAVENARCKALEVYERLRNDSEQAANPPVLIIGADTVVVQDDKILEKPRSREQACEMLRRERGREHNVYTGVALVYPGPNGTAITHKFYAVTTVQFANVDDATIEAYVATGDPMDKAGAYGIQSLAACFVTSITGDFFNVAGFPLSRIFAELSKLAAQGAFGRPLSVAQ